MVVNGGGGGEGVHSGHSHHRRHLKLSHPSADHYGSFNLDHNDETEETREAAMYGGADEYDDERRDPTNESVIGSEQPMICTPKSPFGKRSPNFRPKPEYNDTNPIIIGNAPELKAIDCTTVPSAGKSCSVSTTNRNASQKSASNRKTQKKNVLKKIKSLVKKEKGQTPKDSSIAIEVEKNIGIHEGAILSAPQAFTFDNNKSEMREHGREDAEVTNVFGIKCNAQPPATTVNTIINPKVGPKTTNPRIDPNQAFSDAVTNFDTMGEAAGGFAWPAALRSKIAQLESEARNAATIIQKNVRMTKTLKVYLATLSSIIIIQSLARQRAAKHVFVTSKNKNAVIVMQKNARMVSCRTRYKATVSSIIIIQALARQRAAATSLRAAVGAAIQLQALARKRAAINAFAALKNAVIVMQKNARMVSCRTRYKATVSSIITIQALARQHAALLVFSEVKSTAIPAIVKIQSIARRMITKRSFSALCSVMESIEETRHSITLMKAKQMNPSAEHRISTYIAAEANRIDFKKNRTSVDNIVAVGGSVLSLCTVQEKGTSGKDEDKEDNDTKIVPATNCDDAAEETDTDNNLIVDKSFDLDSKKGKVVKDMIESRGAGERKKGTNIFLKKINRLRKPKRKQKCKEENGIKSKFATPDPLSVASPAVNQRNSERICVVSPNMSNEDADKIEELVAVTDNDKRENNTDGEVKTSTAPIPDATTVEKLIEINIDRERLAWPAVMRAKMEEREAEQNMLDIECLATAKTINAATIIGKNLRRTQAIHKFKKSVSSAIKLQALARKRAAVKAFAAFNAVIVMQKNARMVSCRTRYKATVSSIITIQALARKQAARSIFKTVRSSVLSAVINIQKSYRMSVIMKSYQKAAIVIQKNIRMALCQIKYSKAVAAIMKSIAEQKLLWARHLTGFPTKSSAVERTGGSGIDLAESVCGSNKGKMFSDEQVVPREVTVERVDNSAAERANAETLEAECIAAEMAEIMLDYDQVSSEIAAAERLLDEEKDKTHAYTMKAVGKHSAPPRPLSSNADHYDVLNLDRDCTEIDIEDSFTRLARINDSQSPFRQQIQTAYDVLSDESQRMDYNAELRLAELKRNIAYLRVK